MPAATYRSSRASKLPPEVRTRVLLSVVNTVKNWFATSDQGRVEDLVREMIRDPDAPLEGYGGSRDNVRLTSVEDAKRYIEEYGGNLPWGLRD